MDQCQKNISKAAIDKVRPSGGLLVGFKMSIGMTDIFRVEADSVLEGLKLVWSRWFKQVKLERRNAALIESIRNELTAISNVEEIRMIHDLRHIQRNANKIVDCLAKADGSGITQLFILDDPYFMCEGFWRRKFDSHH